MVKRFMSLLAVLVAAAAVVAGCGGQSEEVKQAVAACKSSIDTAPGLNAQDKTDLKKLCDDAADGNEQEVRDAARQVCNRIVERSGLPAEQQTVAKQTCEQSTAG